MSAVLEHYKNPETNVVDSFRNTPVGRYEMDRPGTEWPGDLRQAALNYGQDKMEVLLVDDDSRYAELVERALSRHKHLPINITRVTTLAAALARLGCERFDVILMDLNLPDTKGIESIEGITLSHNRIPAIVMSDDSDEHLAIKVIQAGAQDFLMKGPEGLASLHRTICYAIERKSAEFRLRQLASYDSLTNLANRQELYFQLEKACAHADRHGDMVALFLFDLDRFKQVNDRHGHHAGDAVLRAFARQLQKSIRTGDTAARLGGDEFAVVLEGIPNAASAIAWSEKILKRLDKPFLFDGHEFSLSASIGGAFYPAHGGDVKTLMHSADLAMYKAKKGGRRAVEFYDEQLEQSVIRNRKLEESMKQALDNNEFQPFFQPKVCLKTFDVVGYELFCRWVKPCGDVVMPSEFLPIAQKLRLMSKIGDQMRYGLIRAVKHWEIDLDRALPVSINVCAEELTKEDYWSRVVTDLHLANIDTSLLRIEVAETLLLEKTPTTLRNINKLRAHGIRVDLNGFGAGHASLYYLKKFSIDGLKLDHSLVRSLGEDKDGQVISRTIVSLANELGLNVIAKGIETAHQLRLLADMGCATGQGYLIGRPMPFDAICDWLQGPAQRLQLRLDEFTGAHKILEEPARLTSIG
ncbi:MAG: EAL domain-containing protein [Pseudomonadota bacterium]